MEIFLGIDNTLLDSESKITQVTYIGLLATQALRAAHFTLTYPKLTNKSLA